MGEQKIKKLYVNLNTGKLWLISYDSPTLQFFIGDDGTGEMAFCLSTPEKLGLEFVDYFLDLPAPQPKLNKVKKFFKEVFKAI